MRRLLFLLPLLALSCRETTELRALSGRPVDPDAWRTWERPEVDCGGEVRPTGALAHQLHRWPYLQSVSSDRAIVVWGVAETAPTLGAVEFGPDASYGRTAEGTLHQTITLGEDEDVDLRELRLVTAVIDGVEPGSMICWRLRIGDELALAGRRLRLAPPTVDAPVDFMVIGDYGDATSDQARIAEGMSAYAATTPIDFLLTTGDNAYPDGTHDQFDAKVFGYYRELWAGPFTLWPSSGNHDYITGLAAPYLENFVLPRQALNDFDQERYYSFDWGPLHVVVLDSELSLLQIQNGRDDDMADWLTADLAATDKPWKIAVWHRPILTGNPGREPNFLARQKLAPILEEYGVQLVFNGHEHFYERFAALRGSEPTPVADGGIAQITTGGGGRRLYSIGEAEHQEAVAKVYHYVRGGIRGCDLWIEAVDVEGEVFDRVTYTICE